MNDDVKRELRGRWVKAQANVDQFREEAMLVAAKVYANPRDAVAQMMKFSRKYDDAALIARLEEKPEAFGALKGSFRSGQYFTRQGIRDEGVAKDQAKILPGLIKKTLEADTQLLALEKALGDPPMTEGRSKDKDGPDFH
ncbi:BID domain-containing protein [Rhizobium leguminosarum]|uniref:BID domain-containing protein n=1 Tax=Rhizobium leguminosarum TaxID=384 RepID=UPI001038131D|nr:BID domain-containing protein [Rhizobium leguminosarum]TBF85698.1 hypothetical protein ELG85_37195 [Rhizobium leguminosarum]